MFAFYDFVASITRWETIVFIFSRIKKGHTGPEIESLFVRAPDERPAAGSERRPTTLEIFTSHLSAARVPGSPRGRETSNETKRNKPAPVPAPPPELASSGIKEIVALIESNRHEMVALIQSGALISGRQVGRCACRSRSEKATSLADRGPND